MSKGGSSKTTTQTQKIKLPGYIQAPLTAATADATNLYNAGAPTYYGGETVAPLNNYQTSALDQTAALASAGSPLVKSGQQFLQDTLDTPSGAGNPTLDALLQQYGLQANNLVNSNFNKAGRVGSGMNAAAAGTAITNATLPVLASQYNADQNLKLQAANAAPNLANYDFTNLNRVAAVGDAYQGQAQNVDNANKAAYDYNSTEPENFLNNYLQQLYTSPGTKTPTTTTSATQTTGGGSTLSNILGGAATLAGLFTGTGPLVGLASGLGSAAGGGIASLLGGLGVGNTAINTAGSALGGSFGNALQNFALLN